MDLTNQVALVTGGAVRLGRAVVEALARQRVDVVVHYRQSAAEANELVGALQAGGRRAWAVRADLISEEACRRLIEESIAQAGRLDLLVNNAAVFHPHRLAEATMERVLDEFWPNFFAPLQLMRHFARAAARGRIVNLLDRRVAGHDAACLSYVLSKKALAELTALAALELAPRFTVNAVAPGAILPPPGEGEGYLVDHAGPVPLELRCTPAAVAAAVVYLLQADEVTGQTLFVDGGQHLLGSMKSEG